MMSEILEKKGRRGKGSGQEVGREGREGHYDHIITVVDITQHPCSPNHIHVERWTGSQREEGGKGRRGKGVATSPTNSTAPTDSPMMCL